MQQLQSTCRTASALQVVWRMRVLGFNAIRLPMRFTEFDLNPLIIKHPCQVAPAVRAQPYQWCMKACKPVCWRC